MELTRLQDRGARTGQINYRKEVYVFEKNNEKFVLSKIVDTKLSHLFESNIQAYTLMNNYGFVPKLVEYNQQQLEFITSWEGRMLTKEDTPEFIKESLFKMFILMKDLNSIEQKELPFDIPYYLKRFLQTFETSDYEKDEALKNIYLLLEKLKAFKVIRNVGFGINDYVASNFVIDDNGVVSLVDVDNLDLEFDFMCGWGFMYGDLDIDGHTNMFRIEELFQSAGVEQNEFARMRFNIGKLSQLIIPKVDKKKGIKTDRPIDKLDQKINETVSDIQKYLEHVQN